MNDHVLERSIPLTPRVTAALSLRTRLMAMTQASHDAALIPAQPGGLPHPVRAALAARIARICQDSALAAHYDALSGTTPNWAVPGVAADDAAIDALIAYTDKITRTPHAAGAADMDALRRAGWDDGDIVRLAGLVAFVNYQLRVAAVLRAMGASA